MGPGARGLLVGGRLKKMSEAKKGTFDENPLGSSDGAGELGARDQADAVVSMHSSPV